MRKSPEVQMDTKFSTFDIKKKTLLTMGAVYFCEFGSTQARYRQRFKIYNSNRVKTSTRVETAVFFGGSEIIVIVMIELLRQCR